MVGDLPQGTECIRTVGEFDQLLWGINVRPGRSPAVFLRIEDRQTMNYDKKNSFAIWAQS